MRQTWKSPISMGNKQIKENEEAKKKNVKLR